MFSSKKIYHGQPGTTLAALTPPVPAGQRLVLKNIHAINNSASAESSVSLFVAKSVDQAVASTKLFNSVPYKANERENVDLFIVLEEGDVIFGSQSAAGAVTLYLSGVAEGAN